MEDNLSVPGFSPSRDGGTGACSTPSSPRLSNRLGRVTRLLSRSDANLVHSLKHRRSRHDSGDSVLNSRMNPSSTQTTASNTPEDGGSPSKHSLMARASGYMSHLKSRLGKHRKESKDNQRQRSSEREVANATATQSLCCGHKRQAESSDTITGAKPGSSSLHDGESVVEGSASISVNVSANNSELYYCVEDVDETVNNYNPSNTSNCIADLPCSTAAAFGLCSGNSGNSYSINKSYTNNTTTMASSTQFPFCTLNVHLKGGKNLVARDSCGSSDPYVKVKIGDKLHYKTKTIYRDLNPTWDESFVLPINDVNQMVIFKVMDFDWGFADDFMGMAALDVSRLPPNKAQEITLTLSETIGIPPIEPLGEIVVSVTLIPRTIEEKEILQTNIETVGADAMDVDGNVNVNDENGEAQDGVKISLPGPVPVTSTTVTDPSVIVGGSPVTSPDNDNARKSIGRSIQEKCSEWLTDGSQASTRLVDSQRRLKSQIWSSVLTVLLLEAKNLTNDKEERLIMDAFVKFRLGNQKYKSRTIARTSYPKWCEQFDFYLYEGQPQVLEVQIYDEAFSRDYIGRCSIDIGLLAKEITHNQTYQLVEGPGEISLLLTISGTCGAETISDLTNYRLSPDEVKQLQSRYAIRRSLHSLKDVGHLTVKVYEAKGLVAADIGGKSDPFVVLELVNARLQTQTEYRTLNPMWNKIFTFAVKDYTSLLEVTVYDEDKNHRTEFLGKITIPLWKIKNGEQKWYTLKDRKLIRPARGNNPQILLELELAWNPIRAGIRAMDPPEPKFIVPDSRLKREVFLLNIDRLRKIGMGVYDYLQYMQSCVEWEYPVRSLIALILYQVICYTFQPYFIPLFIMLLILKQWLVCAVTGTPLPEDFPEDETLVLDDDDNDDGDGDEKKMSLRQKLQAVQDATQTLQNTLGDIASFCESTRNTLRMVIPFISWLGVLGLFIVTVILYLIPLRYLAMGYGFHKFLRPILRPGVVPTNEVYNLICRVPDNQQLIYYKPLRVLASPEIQRNRSPPGQSGKTPTSGKGKKYKFW